MKIYITKGEWYSIYGHDLGESKWGTDVEIDNKTFAKWQDAFDRFHEVQDEMKKLIEVYP